jgi:hypothetical protein
MLQKGQDTPIVVREDGERLVLVDGFTGWKLVGL